MGWYIGRRLMQMIPVFFGATLLIYAMVFAMPGDPILALSGQHTIPPALAAQIRAQFHLDQPFYIQYYEYIKGALTLNFGNSFSGRPVIDVMARAFPVTFKLAVMALAFEGIFGIGFGVIAGLRKGKLFDVTVLLVSLVLIAIPIFVLGFVIQFTFGVKLGWFPPTVGGNVNFKNLLLPAFVLGGVSFAYIVRLTRTSIAENISADYVRTAMAKGLSWPRVVVVHVLRNSLIPVVTFLGADLGGLMGGAIVTEGIFNVPGVGYTLYQAIIRSESTTVVSMVTVLIIVYLLANLLVDLLYAVLDPRIRYA